jgi:hypothetical protein
MASLSALEFPSLHSWKISLDPSPENAAFRYESSTRRYASNRVEGQKTGIPVLNEAKAEYAKLQ